MSATAGQHAMFRQWMDIYAGHHPKQRAGQAAFNALHQWDPALANSLREHPDLDPFHDDTKLPAFLDHVRERMEVGAA